MNQWEIVGKAVEVAVKAQLRDIQDVLSNLLH